MNTKMIALLMACVLVSMSGLAEAGGLGVCGLPSETGVCRGNFRRFAFDIASYQCVPFVYGGCGGNPNNFKTEEECMAACG